MTNIKKYKPLWGHGTWMDRSYSHRSTGNMDRNLNHFIERKGRDNDSITSTKRFQ